MSRGQQQRQQATPGDGPGGPLCAAWSAHIDGFGDFAGRRERGREYHSDGAVLELHVEPGRISARVQGSRVYHPTIVVQPLSEAVRAGLRALACAERCSPRALLRAALTTPQCGVLPQQRALSMVCTCLDRVRPCKHIFAALYAVGPRLDAEPALLLGLRGVELGPLLCDRRAPRPRRSPLARRLAARGSAK